MQKYVNLTQHAEIRQLISKEHVVVIMEFPDWVQVKKKEYYTLSHKDIKLCGKKHAFSVFCWRKWLPCHQGNMSMCLLFWVFRSSSLSQGRRSRGLGGGLPKGVANFLQNLHFSPQILAILCLQPPPFSVGLHTFKYPPTSLCHMDTVLHQKFCQRQIRLKYLVKR